MIIVSPSTISNSKVLETRTVPKKMLGRIALYPKAAGWRIWARLIVEVQLLRYLLALLPFAGIPFMRNDLALPITQAPIAMLMVIGVVEMRGLRYSKKERARRVDDDEAARRLDQLAFRARAILRKIAARHGLSEGTLHLVMEQSELARIPPLTLVSVQTDTPTPHLLSLDAADREAIDTGLFDSDFDERALAAVNQKEEVFLRDVAQEARGVSAHARLSALLDQRKEAEV